MVRCECVIRSKARLRTHGNGPSLSMSIWGVDIFSHFRRQFQVVIWVGGSKFSVEFILWFRMFFFRHSDIMERSFYSFLGKTTAACLYGFFSFLPWRRCPTYWYLSCSPEKYLPVHVNCAFKRKRVRFATALSKVIIFFMFHVMMHHIFKKRMLTCQPN